MTSCPDCDSPATSPATFPLPQLSPGPPQRPVLGHLVLPAGRRGGPEDRPALPSAAGSLLQTPPRRSGPSVRPLSMARPLWNLPKPGSPWSRSSSSPKPSPVPFNTPPPTPCGLGCIRPKGLSSLEYALVGLGVSESRARPALVGRGAFPLVLVPAGAGTSRRPSPRVFQGSPPASPHHRLSWALQEGLGRAAVEGDSEVFGQGAGH